MLRSSSTPVLGSLLSSISESSPNNNHYHQPEIILTPNKHSPIPPSHSKLSFHQSPGTQHFTTFSCNSSPISPSISSNTNGFRRAQSEGNLESLVSASTNDDHDEFSIFTPSKKFSSRPHTSLLETIPSFTFHNSRNRYEDEYDSDDEEEGKESDVEFNQYGGFFRYTIREDKNVEKKNFGMALNGEMRHGKVIVKDEREEASSQMYLAKGLGIDTDFGSGNGGGHFSQVAFGKGGGGGDNHGAEEHYKRLVNENPGNTLFLRNYAQFLYQSKQDLKGPEEYYSRAILTDPNDGEILSQYAKLLWELKSDKERATGYFERAVQAASEDSHVHAAYANFLWEIKEEEEDEDHAPNSSYIMPPHFHKGAMTSASA